MLNVSICDTAADVHGAVQGSRDAEQLILQHCLSSVVSLGLTGHGGLGCLPLPCAAAQCWLWQQELRELSEAMTGFSPSDKHPAIVRGAPLWYTAL